MDSFTASRVPRDASRDTAARIARYVERTPLVPFTRDVVIDADAGDGTAALAGPRGAMREHGCGRVVARVWLKLENLQPIGSFKIRGASTAILNSLTAIPKAEWGGLCVVTPSAGNMGQGVACMVRLLNAELAREGHAGRLACAVVVPNHAPATKVDAMARYGAEIVKVPFDRWWEVLCTSTAEPELAVVAERTGQVRRPIFIHPCTNQGVLDGNSTCGLEVMEQLEAAVGEGTIADAVFVPWGGGAFCCGVGSVMTDAADMGRTKLVSCEPATAAPMAHSYGPSPGRFEPKSFSEHYRPSFVDGCGGKTLLKGMQDLGGSLLSAALPVPLPHIKRAVKTLVESHRMVAEGAGSIALAAALGVLGVYDPALACRAYAPFNTSAAEVRAKVAVHCGGVEDEAALLAELAAAEAALPASTDLLERMVRDRLTREGAPAAGGVLELNVVCIVSGGCVDTDVLHGILAMTEDDFAAEERALIESRAPAHTPDPPPRVFVAAEVARYLPMGECVAGMLEALRMAPHARAPLRQVQRLPCEHLGLQATMPVAFGAHCGCKCITVFPGNPAANGRSAHQGMVVLFDAADNGRVLALADAHSVTAVRTAAASAAATRLLYLSQAEVADRLAGAATPRVVVALLGTGEQAFQHARALTHVVRDVYPNAEVVVHVWGRSQTKALAVRRGLLGEGIPGVVSVHAFYPGGCGGGHADPNADATDETWVSHAVAAADIVCTLTNATEPLLKGVWLKGGCHVNAVGACTPAHREVDTEVLTRARVVYVDTRVAALAEPGDLVRPVRAGDVVIADAATAHDVAATPPAIAVQQLSDEFPAAEGVAMAPAATHTRVGAVTLFKSLGFALEDLIATRIVMANAVAKKR